MKSKIFFPILAILSLMILAYKDIDRFLPIQLEGVVLDAQTRKPLASLHVYSKKGEEEAFTNSQGAFRFTSWQSLPLTITVKDPGSKDKQVRIDTAPGRLTILFP